MYKYEYFSEELSWGYIYHILDGPPSNWHFYHVTKRNCNLLHFYAYRVYISVTTKKGDYIREIFCPVAVAYLELRAWDQANHILASPKQFHASRYEAIIWEDLGSKKQHYTSYYVDSYHYPARDLFFIRYMLVNFLSNTRKHLLWLSILGSKLDDLNEYASK